MKSAYIVSINSGMESFIYREIEQIIKRGVEVYIFTTKFKKGDVFDPKEHWNVDRINVLSIFAAFMYYILTKPVFTIRRIFFSLKDKTIFELLIALDYSRKMNKYKIQHIHCHFGDRKYFIGVYCKMFLNIPLSLTVHAHELYANPNKKFFLKYVSYADKIVSISDKNRDILVNEFKVDPKKIKVIRLSIDLDNFKKEKKVRVLTVARYTERKGFRELFKAIKIINREDIEFLTIGFGDLDLHKLARYYGVQDKVTIFSKMDAKQLKYFYNTCDIFCLPSKSTTKEGAEGIPVVLMEAMASEIPIVTTANGSITELVDSTIVEENNVNSLAEGLISVISMLGDNKIGKNNRKKVISCYGEDNIDELKKYLYE